MPSFFEISPSVSEKIFEVFYYIWAWRPSWLCGLDNSYIHSFHNAIDASHKIDWPSGFRDV